MKASQQTVTSLTDWWLISCRIIVISYISVHFVADYIAVNVRDFLLILLLLLSLWTIALKKWEKIAMKFLSTARRNERKIRHKARSKELL